MAHLVIHSSNNMDKIALLHTRQYSVLQPRAVQYRQNIVQHRSLELGIDRYSSIKNEAVAIPVIATDFFEIAKNTAFQLFDIGKSHPSLRRWPFHNVFHLCKTYNWFIFQIFIHFTYCSEVSKRPNV